MPARDREGERDEAGADGEVANWGEYRESAAF